MADKGIYERLMDVQDALNVPKSNYNSFGKYSYRKAEDILAAVKPLLRANRFTLVMSDEVRVMENGWTYVYSVATLYDWDGMGQISATACAREEEDKKGQDAAQTTGSASSYARKYALCGLFAIDGEEDPDATNTHGQAAPQKPKPNPRNEAVKRLNAALAAFAESSGGDLAALKEGIKSRPDFEDSAEFYNKVAAEFEGAVNG